MIIKNETYLFLDKLKLLKFVDLRKTPSLEIGMMLVFSYLPYGLAEGLHLSGKYCNVIKYRHGSV